MPGATITIVEDPSEEDHLAILNPLIAFNDARTGDERFAQVAIMLKDDAGLSIGGLWGKFYYDWFFVELLFVPENLRGGDFGTRLLEEAERIAREKASIGIWLDTFSFQAPGFYEKRGYERFGTIDDYPKGAQRLFYRKRF